ncbi:MAG: hypothetical protein E7384_00005 [Ruminococcaceae bacterium]|nr:hypothetical protein [Oscillospiraceae bacterium]
MSSKIKKYIFPFIFSIVIFSAFLQLSFFLEQQDADLGGIVILLFALILFIGVLIPIYCFIYGKKVLLKEKRKFIFTLYNSAVITLFYLLPKCTEGETYIYSLILFAWCESWSLIPLLKFKKNTRKTETNI